MIVVATATDSSLEPDHELDVWPWSGVWRNGAPDALFREVVTSSFQTATAASQSMGGGGTPTRKC